MKPSDPVFMTELAMEVAPLEELCKRHGVDYDMASELMTKSVYRAKLGELRAEVDKGSMAFDDRVLRVLGDALDVILETMGDAEVSARDRMDAAKLVLQMGGKLNKSKEVGAASVGPSLTIVNNTMNVKTEEAKKVFDVKMPKLPMKLVRDGEPDRV